MGNDIGKRPLLMIAVGGEVLAAAAVLLMAPRVRSLVAVREDAPGSLRGTVAAAALFGTEAPN